MKREVKPEKIKAVKDLTSLLNQYPVVGILNTHKLPSKALQKIKKELHEKALIKVIKKTALLFALDKTEKKNLKDYVKIQPALILSKMDPFRLYVFLQKNKSSASAKPGDIAINDIEVKTGPTDLMPGPAISTLTKVGIPAKVESGKIAVFRDKIVCKKGDKISSDLAAALQLLKIEPMEVGLNLESVWENGTIYTKDQLYFDIEDFLNNISLASSYAINLSINTGYTTKDTIPILLSIAHANAKALEALMYPKEEQKTEEKKEEPKEERVSE